eukprot:gnl/TRDRNA2_/TRDRNA2_186869_c0_seq1.p1 gnl/TRDRNA2_/TRDRNA2_186869_c0~~gnl/TRDRNA2_/TRDRNA2_186869_c0_seq1.p1  ORF type:complete len:270 (-),score=46.28 gnl/TRDRNA2_/TRDRNA2_186869_c0_seq1:121-930(-)
MVGMEEKSASAPNLLVGPDGKPLPPEVRSTWTSAARAVLNHHRRMEAAAEQAEKSGGSVAGSHSGNSPRSGDQAAPSKSMASSASISSGPAAKKMPREVTAWLEKGMEFTDGGCGIGDRFGLDHVWMARRSPGPAAYEQHFGNISLWNPEAPLPTKQPAAHHPSCEAHKMGERRDISRRMQFQPAPGAYEFRGFAEESQYRIEMEIEKRRRYKEARSGSASDEKSRAPSSPPKPVEDPGPKAEAGPEMLKSSVVARLLDRRDKSAAIGT